MKANGMFKQTRLLEMIMFRELIRDKIFISLSGAAVVLVAASLILNEMVVGQEIKATKDLGLSVLNVFSLFILIFLGVNQVSRDLTNKSLYFLFSRPISRAHYLLGSWFSILAAVAAGILVMSAVIFLLSFLQQEVWLGGIIAAGFLTMLEMMVLSAFALFFVLIASPQLAMFLTLLTYVIGHTIEKAAVIIEQSANLPLKYLITVLDAVLPNLEFFNKKPEIVYGLPISADFFLHATLYAFAYALLVLLVSMRVLAKKEL